MSDASQTIFALASAAGRAGVAVFRVSGPNAHQAIEKACSFVSFPEPRKATYCKISDFQNNLIDHSLVLWFPAPHSFTGEDVVEFHVHGGRAIIKALTETLGCLPNFRLAEPGEFTRRAFDNGKLDLTEAEAIIDLVDAETAAQHRQALRQMEGVLGQLYRDWGERLKNALALMDAVIDFADEDLPENLVVQTTEKLQKLKEEITQHLTDNHRGEKLREGFTVVLLGPPNAGKSSLLNALARFEAAIVAPTPGTTRDTIEVHLDLGGYPVTLIDTAGLCESDNAIEAEGIRRALARAEKADLKLLVFDGTEKTQRDKKTTELHDENSFIVINKTDLIEKEAYERPENIPVSFVSAKTGEGLKELSARLTQFFDAHFGTTEQPVLTRARHRKALEECQEHLTRALAAPQPELCAEDTRLALRALGRITGQVRPDDLLDIIFRDFCIGK